MGAPRSWLTGAMSLFLTTSDAHTTYEVLRDRGVDITDEPAERPYGVDFGIRDPFGDAIRIGQMFTEQTR